MTADRQDSADEALKPGEQAADWWIRLQEDPDDRLTRTGFDAWLTSSSDNSAAWEQTCKAWRALGTISPVYHADWETAPRIAKQQPQRRRTGRWSGWRRTGSIAAAAGMSLCLLLLAAPGALIRLQADHVTATGQLEAISLPDGSTVTLAAASAIKQDFSGGRRNIVLLAGEAFFDVKKDTNRPFIVTAGDIKIEVLGTAFDVQLADKTTDVALARGAVKASFNQTETSGQTLAPGERLRVDRSTGAMTKEAIAIDDIGAWRDGRLYVVDATIRSVVEQIQPYHSAMISIPDTTLAEQKVTGFYDLRDPDQALEALVQPYGGKVRALSGLLRVISRL
jgi:transmembrane sensor